MLEPERTSAIFADAWELYGDAVDLLGLGRTRIAAEAAWGATKRATDALILARTGREPMNSPHTSRGLRFLAKTDPGVAPLRDVYRARQSRLHGRCFYQGILEPEDELIDEIRATPGYIRDAEMSAAYRS